MADLSGTINSIISSQTNLANSAASSAQSAVNNALSRSIILDPVDTTLPDIPSGSINVSSVLPQAPNVDFNFGQLPDVPNISVRSVDPTVDFRDAPEEPDIPDRPSPNIVFPELNSSAPNVNTNFDIPESPFLANIDVPQSIDVEIPEAPDITIADFQGIDAESFFPSEASDYYAEHKADYEKVLPEMKDFLDDALASWITRYNPEFFNALEKLESKINEGIDGGTAISDDIEQQIYGRARDRAEAEAERARDELTRGMGRRGYDMPPGAVQAGLTQIQQATAKNLSGVAAETAIERAKMENQHAQFLMTLSSEIRSNMLNLGLNYSSQLVQINGQAIQYSAQLAQLLVDQHNQEIEKFRAVISLAQTQAAVYDAQLKASLADITIFEAEIEAARLQKDIERIDVSVYQARIEAENQKIQRYLAELQGLETEVRVEKNKVEVFGEEVRAYVAQVQAKSAELEVFRAALQGDETKARLYTARVQAYQSEISAEQSKAELQIGLVDADVKTASAILDSYRAEVAAFVAEAQAKTSANSASQDSYRARIEAFRAERDLAVKQVESQLSVNQLQAQTSIASMEAKTRSTIAQQQIIAQYSQGMANAGVSAGSVYATLAGSVMSGTNSIVSLAQESTG